MIDYRFSLELTKGGIQRTLHAKSGEGNGRRALITLTESGKVFDVEGSAARVFFDDNTHSDYLAIVGGCFEFVMPSALLGSSGEKKCELQIEKDGGVIYSPIFSILVEKSIGGEAVDSVEIGDPIKYQEVIQSLPVGNEITNADEVAVFSSDLKRTQRVKLSNFAKKEDIDEVSEKLDYIENNLSQVGDSVLDIDTKTKKNESDIVALGNRVSVTEAQAQNLGKRVSTIEGYNIPQRFDEVNNRIDNINISGGVESKIQVAEFIVDDINVSIHMQNISLLTIEANIPINARVKKIEIPDFVNGTDEYIALEDMVSKDPIYGLDTPYFIMYPKGKVGQYCPFVAAAVVFPFEAGNSYYEQSDSVYDKTIKIYYEIEE